MPDASPLCTSTAEFRVERITVAGDLITVHAVGQRRCVPCPACGVAATPVHGRYNRTLSDLPWPGVRVRLVVAVRRLFCAMPECVSDLRRAPARHGRALRAAHHAGSRCAEVARLRPGRPGKRTARRRPRAGERTWYRARAPARSGTSRVADAARPGSRRLAAALRAAIRDGARELGAAPCRRPAVGPGGGDLRRVATGPFRCRHHQPGSRGELGDV